MITQELIEVLEKRKLEDLLMPDNDIYDDAEKDPS